MVGPPAPDVARLRQEFQQHGQGHVFERFEELSDDEKVALARQAELIYQTGELVDIARSIDEFKTTSATPPADLGLQPFADTVVLAETDAATRARWQSQGLKLICDGKAAAIVLAGGQGSRLGYDGPKGTMDIGLASHKSLFQIQAERLRRLEVLAGGKPIRWYIMCSDNEKVTRKFFEEHSFFGLQPSQIFFFSQFEIPCISFEGKILMEAKGKIATSPNGNGGVYSSLQHSGALADMKQHGIEIVHVFCVDNVLSQVADPVFLGFCSERKAEAAAKVVEKRVPDEPCGVLALDKDRKTRVIEYSEIPRELSSAKDEKTGLLIYRAANVCIHAFTVGFLERVASVASSLPYHFAKKKIAHIHDMKPSAVNGLKREKFIFDSFLSARSFAAMQVEKSDEFSPVKNATGLDSPATAVAALTALHKQAILDHGGKLLEGRSDPRVEISPLVWYGLRGAGPDADSLRAAIVRAGTELRTPVHVT